MSARRSPFARVSLPRGSRLAAAIIIGVALGLGLFTFGYAKGYSYLSNDPAVCANCHIMSEHYTAWAKASHHAVATCNDCHTPHNLLGKYTTKALNGFWHSFYFTTGTYPDPLRITPRNQRVTESACRDCHGEITEAIDPELPDRDNRGHQPALVTRPGPDEARDSCIRCHQYVGHLVR